MDAKRRNEHQLFPPSPVFIGRIDRIDLHRNRADIGDVVPSPRRNEDTPAVRNFLLKVSLSFAAPICARPRPASRRRN